MGCSNPLPCPAIRPGGSRCTRSVRIRVPRRGAPAITPDERHRVGTNRGVATVAQSPLASPEMRDRRGEVFVDFCQMRDVNACAPNTVSAAHSR